MLAQRMKLASELAGEGKPVWAILETTNGGQWVADDMRAPTPVELRAEVWMAIINGATGIGYFPHVWKPTYEQCRIPEENQEALRRINAEVTLLAPVILSPALEDVTCESGGELPIDAAARHSEEATYVFAVNLLRETRTGRFTVPGLAGGERIEVIGEGRDITSEAGGFADEFGELAVHLYRIE